MRHVFKLILSGILLAMALVSPSVAFASDISSATYSGVIVVTNNSTAASNVSTVMTLSSADMISQGWISSNFSNMAIRNSSGADVVFGPSVNSTYPWSLWVPSIGGNSAINYTMYTGPSDMSSVKYWFPASAGGNVTDSASLEPSNNGTMPIRVWVDVTAGSNKTIFYKTDAIYEFVSPYNSGNITAQIVSGNETLWPDGAGDETGISTLVGAATHWQAESDNSTGSFVYTANASYERDLYTIGNPAGTDVIRDVIVYLRYGTNNPANPAYIKAVWKIGGTVYEGSENTATANETILTQQYTTSPATNLPWTIAEVTAAQLGASIHNGGGGTTQLYDEWVVVRYVKQASVAGLSSGEKTITPHLDGANFWLTVDGSASSNTTVAAVPNNSNIWVIGSSATPYIQSANVTVGGNLKGSWNWEYATTFTDDSGNGNTLTPSFRTASSDADVSAALTSFGPINVAIGPPYAVNDPPDFISTSNITMSANFSTGSVPSSNLPGSAVIDASSTAAGIPNIWLWGIFGGLLIAVLGLVISWMERTYGGGNGTLLARFGVGAIVMGLMVTLNGRFDWWMLLMYCAIALAPVVASRQYDVGASPSELNLIGFLAMTWLGVTTINKMMGAVIIDSAQTTMVNQWMFTQNFKLLDLFSMPILNFQFFTQGIPALVRWDYLSFGGNAQIIQYLLYSLTAVVGFIVFVTTAGLMTSYFTRAR